MGSGAKPEPCDVRAKSIPRTATRSGPIRSDGSAPGLSFRELARTSLLVSHLPNIRYLCGFTGSAALLLVEASRKLAFYRQPLHLPGAGRGLRDSHPHR